MPAARSIDRGTARRYLVLHHLLAPPRSLPPGADESIDGAIRRHEIGA